MENNEDKVLAWREGCLLDFNVTVNLFSVPSVLQLQLNGKNNNVLIYSCEN